MDPVWGPVQGQVSPPRWGGGTANSRRGSARGGARVSPASSKQAERSWKVRSEAGAARLRRLEDHSKQQLIVVGIEEGVIIVDHFVLEIEAYDAKISRPPPNTKYSSFVVRNPCGSKEGEAVLFGEDPLDVWRKEAGELALRTSFP